MYKNTESTDKNLSPEFKEAQPRRMNSINITPPGITNISINDERYVLEVSSFKMAERLEDFLVQQINNDHHVIRSGNNVTVVSKSLDNLLLDLSAGNFILPEAVDLIKNNELLQKEKEANENSKKELADALSKLEVDSPSVIDDKQNDAPHTKRDKYESCEHRAIGNWAFAKFINTHDELAPFLDGFAYSSEIPVGKFLGLKSWFLKLPNGVPVSVGDIVALAGDFFGVPDKPIAHGEDEENKKVRFINAYNTLAHASPDTINSLLDAFHREADAITSEIKERGDNASTANALEKLNKFHAQDIRYTKITGGRYLKLAVMNFDHFGDDAKEAYRIGHTLALETALIAQKQKNETLKKTYLTKAFIYEAYACHFLTDLFSAGHMRTPRKALSEQLHKTSYFFPEVRAGWQSYKMHHEDNTRGLNVKSKNHPEPWLAFGDSHLLDKKNQPNLDYVVEAMQDGLDDVYSAYLHPENAFKFSYVDHLPDYKELNNHEPMYKVTSNGVIPRPDVPDAPPAAKSQKPLDKLHQWIVDHSPTLFKSNNNSKPISKDEIQAHYEDLEKDPNQSCCFR